MKFEKCKKCRYKEYYGNNIFPCSKCKNGEAPLTCYDCRFSLLEPCKNDSIKPCKNFKWW